MPDDRAAWGHWAQLIRIVKEKNYDRNNPIGWLFHALRDDSPRNRSFENPLSSDLQVGDLSIQIDWNHEVT